MSDHFVHETSWVDDGVAIGAGTKIWFFCHVQRGASLGAGCILGQNVNIDRDVQIGNGVKIQNNVSVYKGVRVLDDAFLGPSCVFTNVINPRSHVERKTEFLPTVVGRGATVGANSTIVCGNSLGDYCMVGAGAVVSRPVRPHALVIGVPARQIGWVCRCGVRLDGSATPVCGECGDRYVLRGDQLELVTEGS